MRYGRFAGILLMTLSLTVAVAHAREFRASRFIATPAKPISYEPPADDGTIVVKQPVTLDPHLIRKAFQVLFDAWSTPELAEMLDDGFTNRQQILNLIAQDIPFNARINILGVSSVRVLHQRMRKNETGSDTLYSVVAAEVTTQVIYQDPQLGYQQIEGTGEYVIEVSTETAP